MKNTKAFDFSKVVLGSQIDLAFVGQASMDGFLAPGASEDLTNSGRKMRNKQEALASLVLFDKVILLDSFGGNYEIPILEREGILQINRDEQLLLKDFEGGDWYRNRDPEVFARVLDRTVSVRPLVLEYLARRRFEFIDTLAQSLDQSHKEIINSIIDLAHFHYLGDKDRFKTNPIVQALPSDFIRKIRKDLTSQPPKDHLNFIDIILLGAAHAGALIDYYARLSKLLKTGIATNEFSGQGRLWTKRPEIQSRIEGLADAFCLVRTAIHVESAFFPKIEDINHALRLRKDTNLKAFREQLALFQGEIIRGDGSDLFRLVKEVNRSAMALKRNSVLQRGLDWLTFASLPISIVETLINGLPVASFSLSVFSIGATMYNKRIENHYKWVLFGR